MPETIYTIGHGRAAFPEIQRLLDAVGVSTLVDVRSSPVSRRAPHFSRPELDEACAAAGIGYRYLGRHLGGRPTAPELLTPEGEPDPLLIAATPGFAADLGILVELAADGPIAMLCSEEDPGRCHRATMIAPELVDRGVSVAHLRHDGTVQPHQDPLFGA
ncbi:MAG TPA: DUF488 domain-containing protein [Acidimicrobiia bacterium]|nr:DUF488 domain-containing protein [Acidimicrobiia bacterium]